MRREDKYQFVGAVRLWGEPMRKARRQVTHGRASGRGEKSSPLSRLDELRGVDGLQRRGSVEFRFDALQYACRVGSLGRELLDETIRQVALTQGGTHLDAASEECA